ncbi:hypothetical protein BX666DRAFT_1887096 [Dichotomocladium elegans]|nr:hypothetical protein BX666DRAFT_1887096 [Dichotomocladium elegans]
MPLQTEATTASRKERSRWGYINLLMSSGLLLFCTTTFFLCLDNDGQPICLWSSPHLSTHPSMPNPCPDYTEYAKSYHDPGSGGPLNLPFQRPIEACRRFTSKVIDGVIETISSRMTDPDLAQLFINSWPSTLDTTVQATSCIIGNITGCNPLAFVITGDINAMWLRDSANQLLPYIDYIQQDVNLKRLFLGLIYMQAQFIHLDPYANAFKAPPSMSISSNRANKHGTDRQYFAMKEGVFENKWEIDSLASFLGLSYRYWNATGDDSFVYSSSWTDAVNDIIRTIQQQQEPTFDPETGQPNPVYYSFTQNTDRPTETQFLNGRGNAVKRTGLVKSLFRPSDDATIYPFFIPGNAMISVELGHVSELIAQAHRKSGDGRLRLMADQAFNLSKEIRDAIYNYAVVKVPGYDDVFAYEVDGYGSKLIMDDANIPSLLSLSMIGFVSPEDPVYKNTRRLVLSRDNPYYFDGPRGSGIGGPHVGLNYAWPMSQIVRILSSTDDNEIKEALNIILRSTDGTGLIHESFNVFEDDGERYTRSWFAWANGLFGRAILKLAKERPHLIFENHVFNGTLV